MLDLKSDLYSFLKFSHQGRENVITVKQLAQKFEISGRRIRLTLEELDLEGKPIVAFTDHPAGVCYAHSQDEIERYRASLVSRLTALKERIEALERIRLEPEQGELF